MDTYVIQLEGTKEWFVYDNNYRELPSPWMKEKIGNRHDPKLELLANFTLSPGDMLYMPAGYPHEATTNYSSLSSPSSPSSSSLSSSSASSEENKENPKNRENSL